MAITGPEEQLPQNFGEQTEFLHLYFTETEFFLTPTTIYYHFIKDHFPIKTFRRLIHLELCLNAKLFFSRVQHVVLSWEPPGCTQSVTRSWDERETCKAALPLEVVPEAGMSLSAFCLTVVGLSINFWK